jgi:hypothetical protein
MAFSNEVGGGSRQENASKYESGALVPIQSEPNKLQALYRTKSAQRGHAGRGLDRE